MVSRDRAMAPPCACSLVACPPRACLAGMPSTASAGVVLALARSMPRRTGHGIGHCATPLQQRHYCAPACGKMASSLALCGLASVTEVDHAVPIVGRFGIREASASGGRRCRSLMIMATPTPNNSAIVTIHPATAAGLLLAIRRRRSIPPRAGQLRDDGPFGGDERCSQ